MKRSFVRFAASAATFCIALAACSDSTGVGTSTVSVVLTDAPADYIGAAMVDIGAVELLGGAGGPVVLSADGTVGAAADVTGVDLELTSP
jgi:hypothetical protein